MRMALIGLVLSVAATAWADDWTTFYEKSGHEKTPDYETTVAYCKRLAAASPWVHYTTFGTSPQGRDLSLVIVDRKGRFGADEVRQSDNVVFLIQAGIHALMEGKTAESALGRCLRESPESEAFVDFQEYGPSREPAAFFVEPMRREGALIGWIVLQCAINKVNSLFAFTEDLGQTGETFLVNQDGYMLTESNFAGASTILTKRLDDRNIQAKFAEGRGHRTITDYRGRTALTSFEVMPFMGTRWLAVAKIDKDEVTSEHYALHRRYYGDKLLENLRKAPPAPSRESSLSADRRTLRVDMDEFSKAGAGERLQTFGVSTCTGFLAVCPGRFGYLAHISPRDRIYGVGGTNLLGQMAKKIKMFDIYKYERHDVAFFVVATHFDSLLNIIDKILEEDFLLSQIRVMYNGQAETAAIIYDYDENTLGVTWRTKGEDENQRFHNMEDAVDVSRIIERLINEDGEK